MSGPNLGEKMKEESDNSYPRAHWSFFKANAKLVVLLEITLRRAVLTHLHALRCEMCQNCPSKSSCGVLNLSLGKFYTPQSSEQDNDDDDDDDDNDVDDDDDDDDNDDDDNYYHNYYHNYYYLYYYYHYYYYHYYHYYN